MGSGSEMRRKPRRKPFGSQSSLKLKSKTATGGAVEVDARVVDISEGGIGVEVESPLRTGSIVEIAGRIDPAIRPGPLGQRCRVCWCSTSTNGDGRYRAGLSFEPIEAWSGVDSPVGQTEDYYEILQLSCNADPETIHRVFRLMAQRYHPDNQDTGNIDLFRQIKEAYEVLSDPERRAAFDAQLATNRQRRLRIFHSLENSRGVEAERRKRHGILSLLYGRRLTEPDQPWISVRELEDMLGCPREHLEFSLWYLKETHCVTRSDNNKYVITCEGVAVVESEELNPVQSSFPLLLQSSKPPLEKVGHVAAHEGIRRYV